jgi:hypothetical protein
LEDRAIKIKFPTLVALLSLTIGIGITSFLPSQSEFGILISGYLLAFVAYGYLLLDKVGEKALIAAAVVIAIIPCLAFPNLSDDIYRFYWDGYLTTKGISPYAFTPEMTKHIDDLEAIYGFLNSPTYYSIYPLVSQVIFAISVWFGGNLIISAYIIKAIYLLVHLSGLYASLKLARLMSVPTITLCIYYLNPLVLVEGLGNLHAEVMMVAFLAWFIYFFQKSHYISSGISLGLAVGTKLLPLIFIPYLFFNMRGKKRIGFFTSLSITLFLLFIPIVLALNLNEFGSSVDLYFRKFEFNASIYYLLRAIGNWVYGYNMIHVLGPALGIAIFIYVVWSSWSRLLDFATKMEVFLFSFTAYLLLTTTVHPWYIITILYISMWTKYRYALVWSCLVCFTYVNYAYESYHENLWVVAVEYAIVFGIFWREIRIRG